MTQHNKIYESLVEGPEDAVGAFAYALYKQHKVEWTKEIQARHQRSPTPEEVANFHADNALPVQLESYLQRGEALARDFLEEALAQKIIDIEDSVKTSAIARRFEGVEKRLDDRKGFFGWTKDIGTAVIVNVLTILAIGAIILGTRMWNDFNNKLDGKYGAGAAGPGGTAQPGQPQDHQ